MAEDVKNQGLKKYLKSLLGRHYEKFLSAKAEPTSIRTNTLKTTSAHISSWLNELKYEFETISFNPDGFIVRSDPLPLSHSLAFFEGLFQYQGVSSQLPAMILDVKPGDRVLDMTAAPGSKSGQLATLMKQHGELVINDSSYHRLQALQANMQRSGAINHYVLKQRGENLSRLFPEYFDKILLDAPCSALGTYFSSSEKYSWWSISKLEKLSKLQYQLMVSAIKSLRVGGEIVYSTCSVAPEENELLVNRIVKKYPLKIEKISKDFKLKFSDGWTSYGDRMIPHEMDRSLRVWPHLHALEGFFVVKLKKTDKVYLEKEPEPVDTMSSKTMKNPAINQILLQLSDSWGIDPKIWANYRYLLTKTRLWMMSPEIESVPKDNFVSAGLLLGEQRLNGWKLVNGSAQYLSKFISKRRITLSDQEIRTLFREGNVHYKNMPHDYYVLEYHNSIIGSVYHENGRLRMRLPHLFSKIEF